MVKRILVPLDGSPKSEAAIRFVTEEWPDADVVLLRVIDPLESGYSGSAFPSGAEEWYERKRAEVREHLADVAAEHGIDAERVVVAGRPAASIVEVAEDVDHVVMGSHGRTGVSRVVLGSVAEAVVRRSPVPVTIVR
ncbi:universal stress protein [Salinigranum sp.]|uniref:universal stress protein n=1 Tax=Salinigranum sp. TaxID=1966351 RepID=UPI0035688707